MVINELENSIYILGKLKSKIIDNLELFTEAAVRLDFTNAEIENLTNFSMDYGLILADSFEEEYNRYFIKNLKVNKPESYVKGLKIVLNIPRKVISKAFPDIRKLRNHLLAHNMRIDGKENIFLSAKLRKYKVPQDISDYLILVNCINLIYKIIELEFPNAYENIRTIAEETNRDIPYKLPMLEDNTKFADYFESISKEALKSYKLFRIGCNNAFSE